MKNSGKHEATKIVREICNLLGVPYWDLFMKSRKREYVYPRQLAQSILKEKKFSEREIAELFGQHRTTVYNSKHSIESWEISSKEKAEEIQTIRNLIIN